ncbi:MAG: epoxyqueuosine reductase QueH [bacterium]|nr:epoxyqueuosine reductase QueH [bacterium]
MKILLHICCANCATYCYNYLRANGYKVYGFFYNPNIHPYTEYKKRLDVVSYYAEKVNLDVIYNDEYDLEGFLRQVVYREKRRCQFCYRIRLERTAKIARDREFACFTTTLLISPHQQHELIKDVAKEIEEETKIKFFYHDFREGYKESIRISKEFDLYRQRYCGCIYSEKERYIQEDLPRRHKGTDLTSDLCK